MEDKVEVIDEALDNYAARIENSQFVTSDSVFNDSSLSEAQLNTDTEVKKAQPISPESIFSLSSILSLSSYSSISEPETNSSQTNFPNPPPPSRQSPFRFLSSFSDSETSTISKSSSNSELECKFSQQQRRKKNLVSTISLGHSSGKVGSSSATICPPLASMKELIILSDDDTSDSDIGKFERKSIAEFIIDKKESKPLEKRVSMRETFL